jgi:hypothetical protein
MKNLFYALLLLLPLVGCGTFAEFGEKYDAIESETTTLLEGVDQSYEDGTIDATERDELIRSIVLESKARLDAAAREAGNDVLSTGSELLDILLLLLFGGASGTGVLALSRKMRRPPTE